MAVAAFNLTSVFGGNAEGATPIEIPKPVGLAKGEIVCVTGIVFPYSAEVIEAILVEGGGTWTVIEESHNSGDICVFAAYHVAGESEPEKYKLSWTHGSGAGTHFFEGGAFTIKGASATPITGIATAATVEYGNDTKLPTLTPGVAEALVVAITGSERGAVTTPTGFTAHAMGTTEVFIGTKTQGATATGIVEVKRAEEGWNGGILFALAPGGEEPKVTPHLLGTLGVGA